MWKVSFLAVWACLLLSAQDVRPSERGSIAAPELPVDPELTGPVALPAPPVAPVREAFLVEPSPGVPTVTLAQAVGLALERNYQLLGSADALQTARLRESATRAFLFLPKLTPTFTRGTVEGAAATRQLSLQASQGVPWLGGRIEASGSMSALTVDDPRFARAADLRVTLTQPLLRGFGPTAGLNDLTLSRRARENQERTFELARQSLAVDVTSAYFEVIKQRQLLTVARQSLERNQTLQRASEARMKAGLATKLDVYRAELQVSYAQDAMMTAETQLQTALESFRVLLGRHPTDALEPEAMAFDQDLVTEQEPLDVLVQRALSNRLELVETRAQVDDARRNASLARQNLLPILNVTVGAGRTGHGPSFSNSLRGMENTFDVQLTTSYPIERSSDRANKAVADIGVAASERHLGQRRLEIEAEVRAQVRNIERIAKSVELQRKGVELAAQQHKLATMRYQNGHASNFDVIEAEDKLVSARASLASLVTDYHVARVRLMKVTGVLDIDAEFRR